MCISTVFSYFSIWNTFLVHDKNGKAFNTWHFLQDWCNMTLISRTWFTLSLVFGREKILSPDPVSHHSFIAANIKFMRVVAVVDRVCLTFNIYYSQRICWNQWSRKMISFNSWCFECSHSRLFNCMNFHCKNIDIEKKNLKKHFEMCHQTKFIAKLVKRKFYFLILLNSNRWYITTLAKQFKYILSSQLLIAWLI